MPRPKREWRDDQLYCVGHNDWHHHSRFGRRRRPGQNPDVPIWDYDADCKLWQQTRRVAEKNEDEATRIVETKARRIVNNANKTPGPKITLAFVIGGLNYKSLILMVRAAKAWPDESFCPNCGSLCKPEFDHREPPRHARDWARLHARNIGPLDHECNSGKNAVPYAEWLDLEEGKRLSAQAHNDRLAQTAVAALDQAEEHNRTLYNEWLSGADVQLSMFEPS